MYSKVYFLNVSRADEDRLSQLCFSYQALGLSEILDFDQSSDNYEAQTIERSRFDLQAYFDGPPPEAFWRNLKKEFPKIQAKWEEEPAKDWLSEWKKGFQSFELVSEVWVVPSWQRPPQGAPNVIHLEPGMAFGTGTHATTQLAAKFIKHHAPLTGKKVLDVGAGTAILAILSEKLGAEKVRATEIDPQARAVARENLQNNNCRNITILEHQVDRESELYDIVVANIIDGVLITLAPELKRLVKPGGILVLTGILEERKDLFEKQFSWSEAFDIIACELQEEWLGYHLQKKGE